jgi:4-amino-4-deoxy-L-arabinose transferase-like glycosyltransferase
MPVDARPEPARLAGFALRAWRGTQALLTRPSAPLVASFLVALWWRWDFALREHPPELYVVGDMALYLERGRALLERPRTADDLFTPVGYPAFLALCERLAPGDLRFVAGAQAIVSALVAPLSARLARTLSGAPAAWAAGLGVALYFPLVLYTGFLLTESLFSLLLVAAVVAFVEGAGVRARAWAVASGLLLAAGAAVRPSLLVLFPIALGALVLAEPGRERRLGAWTLVAWLVALAPLAVHHSIVRGTPTLVSTNGGVNFFLARSDCRSVRSSLGGGIVEVSTHFNRTRFERTCIVDARIDDERYFYGEGLALLLREPDRASRAVSALAEGLGVAPHRGWPHQPYWPGSMLHDAWIDVFSRGFVWLLGLPGLAGLILVAHRARRGDRAARHATAALGSVLGAVVVALAVYNGNPRVRVSSDPLVVVLAAVALGWLAGLVPGLGARGPKSVAPPPLSP